MPQLTRQTRKRRLSSLLAIGPDTPLLLSLDGSELATEGLEFGQLDRGLFSSQGKGKAVRVEKGWSGITSRARPAALTGSEKKQWPKAFSFLYSELRFVLFF